MQRPINVRRATA